MDRALPRTFPAVLLLPVLALLLGCGAERPGERPPVGAVAPSSASPSYPPTTPASTPPADQASPEAEDALSGFPLALGYDEQNGDDASPVVVSGTPASRAFALCERQVWDPRHGTTDVLGVTYRGEAEWFRGRTLVLYPSEDAAATAVETARSAVTGCPDEPRDAQAGSTHRLVDQPLGDQALVWADTYYEVQDGERRHGTGLTVYHLDRVGRAVLLAYEYGEGNGSAGTRAHAVREATDAARPVVDQMSQLAGPDPSGSSPGLRAPAGSPASGRRSPTASSRP
jgi:hypothetical protein